MVSVSTFAMLGLAAYFLGVLVSRKDGPGQIFKKIRDRLPEPFATAMGCTFCASWWSLLALLALHGASPYYGQIVAYIFGAAGVATVANALSGTLSLD